MEIPEVSCAEAAAMRDAGAVWVDVREPEEWQQARIADTEHIPLAEAVAELPNRYPDKGRQIVISCLSGGRSGQLVAQLRAGGYLDVHNLRGGIRAWANEGRPIITG